jgi:uncharacterized protein YxjI
MIDVSCACGANYTLKDELQGKKVKCPTCGAVSVAGGGAKAGPAFSADLDRAFQRDKFLLRQKTFAIGEKYYVWDEAGETLLFIERPAHVMQNLVAMFGSIGTLIVVGGLLGALTSVLPKEVQPIGAILTGFVAIAATVVVAIALSPKRHVTFYRDESKSQALLKVLQDKKAQLIVATYTVLDEAGTPLARLQKNYLYDIFRKRWYIVAPDSDRVLGTAMEDSLILSMLRRLLGPLFGVLRTNFIITKGETEKVIGEFNRKFTLLDRYVLDMSADRENHLDRRVACALGVMLDTGEKR